MNKTAKNYRIFRFLIVTKRTIQDKDLPRDLILNKEYPSSSLKLTAYQEEFIDVEIIKGTSRQSDEQYIEHIKSALKKQYKAYSIQGPLEPIPSLPPSPPPK